MNHSATETGQKKKKYHFFKSNITFFFDLKSNFWHKKCVCFYFAIFHAERSKKLLRKNITFLKKISALYRFLKLGSKLHYKRGIKCGKSAKFEFQIFQIFRKLSKKEILNRFSSVYLSVFLKKMKRVQTYPTRGAFLRKKM